MSEDTTVEAPVEEKVDLDSLISGAIDSAEKAAPETTEASRSRDDKGRFAKESEPKPSDGTAQAQPTAVDPALAPIEAPRNYTAKQKAIFARLDREGQEILAAEERQREAEFTRKSQAEAEYRRTADPYLNALKPFEQYFAQIAPHVGRQPHEMLADLATAEYRLRNGSVQEKVQVLGHIAASYGIDLNAFARGEIREPDPAQTQQHQLFQTFHQEIEQLKQERAQENQARLAQHIEDFANSKDANGNLAHPLFERAKATMAQILESGFAGSMEDAYNKALRLDEGLHKEAEAVKNQAAIQAEEKRKAEALAKAEKAKPITVKGTQPHGRTSGKDLDSLIRENMARHGM